MTDATSVASVTGHAETSGTSRLFLAWAQCECAFSFLKVSNGAVATLLHYFCLNRSMDILHIIERIVTGISIPIAAACFLWIAQMSADLAISAHAIKTELALIEKQINDLHSNNQENQEAHRLFEHRIDDLILDHKHFEERIESLEQSRMEAEAVHRRKSTKSSPAQ